MINELEEHIKSKGFTREKSGNSNNTIFSYVDGGKLEVYIEYGEHFRFTFPHATGQSSNIKEIELFDEIFHSILERNRKEARRKAFEMSGDILEFAKMLFSTTIKKALSPLKIEEYLPADFKLMLGELEVNGNELVTEFIKDKYGV